MIHSSTFTTTILFALLAATLLAATASASATTVSGENPARSLLRGTGAETVSEAPSSSAPTSSSSTSAPSTTPTTSWYTGNFYQPCSDVCEERVGQGVKCNPERQVAVNTLEKAQYIVDVACGTLEPSLASSNATNINAPGYEVNNGDANINPYVTVDSVSPPFKYTFIFSEPNNATSDCDVVPLALARICCCAVNDPITECPVE